MFFKVVTDVALLESLRRPFRECKSIYRDVGRAYGFVELNTAYKSVSAQSIGIILS